MSPLPHAPGGGIAACTLLHITSREMEVLREVAKGRSDEEIATDLFISIWTVRVHESHLRRKLGVHNRRSLVCEAERLGFLFEKTEK